MNKKQSVLLQRTYIILVFCFMYLPIAVMIAFSFNESKSRSNFTGFTLGWYKSLFHNEMILSALGLSLVLALVSSVVATVLGTLATIGINSMSRKSQLIINNISYVPVVNPEIITGVSLMLLFVMAQNFGITIFNRKDEDAFREAYRKRHARRQAEAVLDAQIYPIRLFILPEAGKRERQDYLQCMRRYSIPTLILMFFIFSFLGWCWEVGIHLIEDGVFVNRGVLHGPWLPIYGSGSILILTLLYRFRRNPGLMFVATVVLCGVIEYFTSVYLEYMHNGMKWWDYSGYFLNLDGRICGEGLLIFGLGGLAITYLTAPLLDNYLRKIPYRISVPVCLILIGAFLADQGYSKRYPNEGAGITDYKGAYVEEIEHANL